MTIQDKPERLKIIIDCAPEHLPQAVQIIQDELVNFARYSRLGWGWSFGSSPRFFVRRLLHGLSIKQMKERP